RSIDSLISSNNSSCLINSSYRNIPSYDDFVKGMTAEASSHDRKRPSWRIFNEYNVNRESEKWE
ncbi:23894_t:CDS:2, partial [Gigaspora margarita]